MWRAAGAYCNTWSMVSRRLAAAVNNAGGIPGKTILAAPLPLGGMLYAVCWLRGRRSKRRSALCRFRHAFRRWRHFGFFALALVATAVYYPRVRVKQHAFCRMRVFSIPTDGGVPPFAAPSPACIRARFARGTSGLGPCINQYYHMDSSSAPISSVIPGTAFSSACLRRPLSFIFDIVDGRYDVDGVLYGRDLLTPTFPSSCVLCYYDVLS